MGVNIVVLGGRLTKDPDIRHTTTRTGESLTFANFTIAVNRDRKGADGTYPTDFHFCKAMGHSADFIEKYFGRGSEILVQGRLYDDKYTNRNGQEVYQKIVDVTQVSFVGSTSAGGRQPEQPAQQNLQPDPAVMGEGTMQQPPAESPSWQPEQTAQQAEEQSTQQAAEQPTQQTEEQPTQQAEEQPTQQAAEQAIQQPSGQPVQQPVQQAEGQPAQQAQDRKYSGQANGAPPFGTMPNLGGYGNGYN